MIKVLLSLTSKKKDCSPKKKTTNGIQVVPEYEEKLGVPLFFVLKKKYQKKTISTMNTKSSIDVPYYDGISKKNSRIGVCPIGERI